MGCSVGGEAFGGTGVGFGVGDGEGSDVGDEPDIGEGVDDVGRGRELQTDG